MSKTSPIVYRGRTALVTGASAGIGAAFARGLAARGADVVLVARRESRLRALAEELELLHGVRATVVAADLSDPDAPAAVRRATDAAGVEVGILVNNAGFGTFGYYDTIDPAEDSRQVMVNVHAMVGLTHEYLPGMVAAGSGVVINISSIAALQPIPHMAVYGASKSFILSFSEALWVENRDRGVAVAGICAGATDTEFFDVVGNSEEVLFGRKVPPSRVVDIALQTVERGRGSVVVGTRNRVTGLAPRLFPRGLVARISGSVTRPRNPVGPAADESVPAPDPATAASS